MSRQIQIRRGTTTEHASFTGAIGEVTMDTDKKTIFVHDGETLGGIQMARADEIPTDTTIPENYDFVIESYINGNNWYRKYKSGWIEQGGNFAKGSNLYAGEDWAAQVNMIKTMTITSYAINGNIVQGSATGGIELSFNNLTTTTFNFLLHNRNSGATITSPILSWSVKGYSA